MQIKDASGDTVFINAIAYERSPAIVELLMQNGIGFDTPLHEWA